MVQKKKKKSLAKGVGTKLRIPRSVFVFETTGFILHGMVAKVGIAGVLDCSEPAVSAAADFTTAIGEVLEQLRRSNKKVPRTAVLITPSAAGKLLPLPIDPKVPKLRAQMKELVRWELEEVFVRQDDIWSLGALLQGRGYISAEQRLELERAESAGPRGPSTNAYRELVSREQLKECLNIQELLTSADDELTTGWCPQAHADEEGLFTWYCAGVGDGVRQAWVKAFSKNGIFCSWVYPQLGSGATMMEAGAGGTLLIDVRQEQVGVFQWLEGRLDALSILPNPNGKVALESLGGVVSRLAGPETRTVMVSSSHDQFADIKAELASAVSSMEIRKLDFQASEAGGRDAMPSMASMRGVVLHLLKMSGPNSLVRIQAQEARPPIWKSKAFWPWAVIVLLFVGIVITETTTRILAHVRNRELMKLDIEYESKKHFKANAKETQEEVDRLKANYAEKEAKLNALHRRRDILEKVIRHRQKLVPGMLQAIAGAVPDGVLLDSLIENQNRSGVVLSGWALRDTEAEQFGSNLNEMLSEWNYKVGDLKLTRGKGRLGLDGYNINIHLIKVQGEATDA